MAKLAAWYNSIAVSNLFAKYPKSFDELLDDRTPQTNEEIAENCRLKGHKVPRME